MRQWMRERQQFLWIMGAILFMATAFLGWWFGVKPFNKNKAPAPLAVLSLEKSMKAHPQWSRFEKLMDDIKALEDRLKQLGLPLDEESPSQSIDELQNPLTMSERRLLNAEAELHMELMMETLKRWEKDNIEDIKQRMRIREEQLQEEIKDAAAEEQRRYKEKLIDYKNQVEMEFSLRIANIEFKLNVPGLSQEEKQALENEALEIKRTMQGLLQAKDAEYARELNAFVEQRQSEAKIKLEKYLGELQADAHRRMEIQQKKLRQEFQDWQNQRIKEHRQSLEKKKRQYAMELNELSSLRGKREILRIRMTADIRRKTRELAEKEGYSAVVLAPLFFSEKIDITDAIVNRYR